MFRPSFSIVLMILLYCAACRPDDLIIIEGLQSIAIDDCMILPQNEYVVQDTASYHALLLQRRDSVECADYQLPPIDFSQKTLLGKLSTVEGCEGAYTYSILANPEAKLYQYRIKASPIGTCHNEINSMNWITIPRLPDGYAVEFVLE